MARESTVPGLGSHIVFLGRIYLVLGWLGIAGAGLLLFSSFSGVGMAKHTAASSGLFNISPPLTIFMLVCWSILLLGFSKDITGSKKWSTGPGGVCIGILNLFSVPIGTAVGTYTLWILFRHSRLQ